MSLLENEAALPPRQWALLVAGVLGSALLVWLVDRYGDAIDIHYRGDVTRPVAVGPLVAGGGVVLGTILWPIGFESMLSAWCCVRGTGPIWSRRLPEVAGDGADRVTHRLRLVARATTLPLTVL